MHRPTHARCATQLTNHIVRGDFTAYFKLLMKLPYTLAAAASVYLPNMRLAMVRQLAVASAIVYDPAGGPLAPLPASVTGHRAGCRLCLCAGCRSFWAMTSWGTHTLPLARRAWGGASAWRMKTGAWWVALLVLVLAGGLGMKCRWCRWTQGTWQLVHAARGMQMHAARGMQMHAARGMQMHAETWTDASLRCTASRHPAGSPALCASPYTAAISGFTSTHLHQAPH
jgi:hypothetical protein